MLKELGLCSQCTLQGPRYVPGEGPITPGTPMFIGEAPGEEETNEGRPFVGSAGRMFNKLLWIADIFRSNLYVTNLCKCRPNNNRTPTMDEIRCCWPILRREIELIQPSMVVALGATVANVFTTKAYLGISNIRGDIYEFDLDEIEGRQPDEIPF